MNLYISAMHMYLHVTIQLLYQPSNVNNTAYICGDNQHLFLSECMPECLSKRSTKSANRSLCDKYGHRLAQNQTFFSKIITPDWRNRYGLLSSAGKAKTTPHLAFHLAVLWLSVYVSSIKTSLLHTFIQGQNVSPQQISIINALHHFILRIHFKSQHCIHYLSR